LQADEGIDVQEASDVTLNNITMISKNTNPVTYILNSDNITLDGLKYKDNADVLAQVQGDRTKAISILNTDTTKAKQKLVANFGSTEATVIWEKPKPVEAPKAKGKKKKN
jgi:hypothetical protein